MASTDSPLAAFNMVLLAFMEFSSLNYLHIFNTKVVVTTLSVSIVVTVRIKCGSNRFNTIRNCIILIIQYACPC